MTKANPATSGSAAPGAPAAPGPAGADGTGGTGGTGVRDSSPRARFRGQIRDEAKALALRQLAEGGAQALSLNAIAKSLGMSGPALYRYFANREALLTDLIVDAYHDLAAAMGAALAAAEPAHQPHDRLAGLVTAYRAWAVAEPHRYRLLFRAPLFGYDPQAPALVEASQPAMTVAVEAVTPLLPRSAPPTAAAALATSLWAGLHGLVSLEIEGNFSSMGLDPVPLYDTQVRAILHAAQA
ncbi:TetR/AcrR family transcriptional regulator [Actinacidiphila bryophytorum]|uniref:Transcriptional regulator, TetR family n=1 Tax=Actinacidiphila bryophytorum TaxID=1436133 RepID=A0A9W4MHH3_9ACTN|nr:TetR/AcrR family transcriptional regulator [Actinacidiphila bryophytorum]MBM9435238.1 TetR/AcrR family transcriptional regulator [Actinacidiphila bryophytorum]MBN6547766.1 TetR/AcrR family transcriptional regulator [Actinacidiphila bryophytorum]CAG7643879.1 Transcriptional regulator, TetR family [Actinacidiphila bryophytorum]